MSARLVLGIVLALTGPALAAPADELQPSHVELVGAEASATYQRYFRRFRGTGVVLGRFGSGLGWGEWSLLFRSGTVTCTRSAPVVALRWACRRGACGATAPDLEVDGLRSTGPAEPDALDAVVIESADPGRAITWFVEKLDAVVLPRSERGVVVGRLKLLFVPQGVGTRCSPVDHIAWSHPDLARFTKRLTQAGVHLTQQEADRVRFDGPDGLRLEIVRGELDQSARYRCPMHPDVRASVAGRCPTCGMPLIRAVQTEGRYRVQLTTIPTALRVGLPGMLRFRIFHPDSGALVRALEEVHEKRLHVFVVSSDLETFEHVHPSPESDGSWSLPIVLPRQVAYQVVTDFFPTDGAPQMIESTLLPAGGRVAWPPPRLVPDADRPKVVDGVRVTVYGVPVAGTTGLLRFHLVRDGAPVRDLERYLGVWAHLMAIDEQLLDVTHAHPDGDPVDGELAISVRFPRPGLYRVWLQVSRHGHVSTVPFTLKVNGT